MADRKNFRPGVGFVNALGVQIMVILGELLNIYLFLLRTGNTSYVPFAGFYYDISSAKLCVMWKDHPAAYADVAL